MPLTRSHTGRSQSRSPLPHIATPRPFLPPSHYAAAAGIPYDENKHITDTTKSNANDSYTRAFIAAYPYDAEPDSQSSFEFKPSKTAEDKPPVPPKLTRRSRRESLLNDLPQLEANLLPSLRDTIDRMTKSPSQPEPFSASHLSIPRPSGTSRSSRSLSPSYASREKLIAKSVTPEPSMKGLASPVDILTPRTNTPAKPSRSTLRPPAPKFHLRASGDSPPSTVRGILKKLPKHDATPPVSEGGLSRRSTVSNGSKLVAPTLRSRSRTDPGILPTTISVADQPPTPSVVEHTDSQPTPRLQPSSIPRFQSRRMGTGTWWSTDESDVDGQEKPRGRDRRQLIIPRTVSHSTSESENERRKGARIGARRDSLNGSQLVGLGIGLGSEKKKVKSGASRQIPSSNPDISLRSTRRITGDRTPIQSHSSTFDPPSEHKQRREALREIVSNLNLDKSSTEGETDYEGEEGVALAETAQQRIDTDVDSDGEQISKGVPPNARKLRPRSTSHTPTPTFLLSPNPDIVSNTKSRPPRHLVPPRTPILKASQSRSPIISQIDTPATPGALRRHSVYHRSPSPCVLTPVMSNDNEDKKLSCSSAGVPKGPRQQRREGANIDSRIDTKVTVPSEDVREETYEERRDDDAPSLPHTESDSSSVGSMYWGDDSESELSPAAETLFQKLGQGKADSKKASSEKALRSFQTPSPSPVPPADLNLRQPRSASASRPRSSRVGVGSPPLVDDTELRRQDLIIEIHQCEETFVKRLQIFVQLFILPLRVQDTKEWIAGVPSEIARLFDWLEDIVVLHTQILASLESTRDAQYPTVECIAEAVRCFVPRLEVYQPYLVNLEHVISLAEELLLLETQESDFAEFVRLQEKAEECEGWNFQSFLIEPVNLLAKFPGLFNRLLELTPKSHKDYMPTLALVRSTEMFIRVMTEVKLREDEYDTIQEFAARIQGLPSSSHLATRDRRLLHHGIVHLVDVEAHDLPPMSGSLNLNSSLFRYFPPGWTGTGTGTGVSSGSVKTLSTYASSVFLSSFKKALPLPRIELDGLGLGRLRTSTQRPADPIRGLSLSSSRGTPVRVFVFSDLLVLAALRSGSGACSGDEDEADEEEEEWTLLNYIGTTRILDVKQQDLDPGSGSGSDVDLKLKIDGSNITSTSTSSDVDLNTNINTTSTSTSTSRTRTTIEVISTNPKNINTPPNQDQDNTNKSIFLLHFESPSPTDAWIEALHRARRAMVCSLCIPPGDGYGDEYNPHLDKVLDAREAVAALVASGLPLPRSPGRGRGRGRVVGGGGGGGEAGVQEREEREERGWWAVRFRQVFREVVRREEGG